MRNAIRSKLVAAGVAIVTVAAAVPAAATEDSSNDFTHEEIVRGLLLGEGPVADKVGLEVERPSFGSESDAEITELQDRFVAQVVAEKATDEVINQLASGDPWQVEDGLRDLTKIAEGEASKIASDAAGGVEISPQCGFVAVCGAVSVAVAALGAATLVVVANLFMTVNAAVIDHNSAEPIAIDQHVAAVTSSLEGAATVG